MLQFAIAVFLSLFASAPAPAEVNCEQVRRYAQTGRSETDIAETMIIDIETVKKCLADTPAQKTVPTKKPASSEK